MRLFTIGHSNHLPEKFIQLLEENAVDLLVDVRSAPYSRYNPQFNKENLEKLCVHRKIEYAYAGKTLGGRPTDPTCYKRQAIPAEAAGEGADYLHEVDYPEVMKRPWFQQGITWLLELAEGRQAAVMCSEEDPAECHRHHLIAKYIMSEHPQIEVRHIRGDGVVFGARSILASVDKPDAEQLSLF